VEIVPVNFPPCSGGYEALQAPDLPERLKAAAETGAWLSSMPARAFDVGRYPVVFNGASAGTLLLQTLGRALESDRVLGMEADAAGTSFLAPHSEVLGTLVLNPLLNVTGNRAMPSALATKWDDEGVAPEEFTLLREGRVVDYCTSRGTANAFGAWYQSQGKPTRSHGCAVARTSSDPIQVRTPHLHLEAGAQGTSLEELYKDIPRGMLVLRCDAVSVDPGINTGMIMFADLFEINRGKIVGRVRDAAIPFNTRNLWKHLTALGDPTTMQTSSVGDSKGNPWHYAEQVATAPAARFEQVDVISIGAGL
jgi:TldD protein